MTINDLSSAVAAYYTDKAGKCNPAFVLHDGRIIITHTVCFDDKDDALMSAKIVLEEISKKLDISIK